MELRWDLFQDALGWAVASIAQNPELRWEIQDDAGRVNPGLWEARKRGVFLDVGHGGGSFFWRVAVPAVKEGLLPDSISTDLHMSSKSS